MHDAAHTKLFARSVQVRRSLDVNRAGRLERAVLEHSQFTTASISPRYGNQWSGRLAAAMSKVTHSAALTPRAAAPVLLAMPTTWWPEASRRAVTAPPIRPVAPITRTRTLIPPFRLARRPPGAPFEQENLIVSGFLPPAGRVGCRLWDRLLRPFSPPGQWQQQRRLAPIRPGALTLGRGPRTCCFTRYFLRQAALQRGHQIDHRWRRADRLWFDRQPLHLCFDQFGQGVLVAVPICPRIEMSGPLPDNCPGDGDHLGIHFALGSSELRRPNLFCGAQREQRHPGAARLNHHRPLAPTEPNFTSF